MGGNAVDGTVLKGVLGTKALFGANKLDDFDDGLFNGFLGAIAELANDLLRFVNVFLSPAKGT
ncbi:MAG: hypothetical protein IM583_00600, partial [Pseudanabaena sp. M114S2SP2A07QC]|nr:hypothetical protein [Pseudanabaena sp. M114S2SP2A07QC]